MNESSVADVSRWLSAMFPAEWVRVALVLALFSVLVVIGLFLYLNQFTKKEYFGRWTLAWIFYAAYLGASIGLEETPDNAFLVMVRRSCIGISALYMFFGSLEFAQRGRPVRELYLGIGMLLIWAAVAAFVVRDWLWITVPVFVLLAAASVYTGSLYVRFRLRYRGANLLVAGFSLWGLHLLAFPFLGLNASAAAGGYLTSAVLAFFIAMGMMVQVLEEAREKNESLVNDYQKGLAQRHALEEQVSLSEEKYRALFEGSSDATFLVDLETLRIVEANLAAQQMLGLQSGPLEERDFGEICPALQTSGKNLMEDKKRFDVVFQPGTEVKLFRSDGTPLVCEGESRLIQANRRPVMQVHVHEVTERKKIEQQLRKYEKLSALGQLIAGVAHELNNPLAVIMGYSQLLTKRADVPEKTKTELQKILHESERAAKIVRNLLTFSRPREPEMTTVQLNQVVAGVVDACTPEIKSNAVDIQLRLSEQLPRTKADPNQLEQVITNLITNAIHAQQKQTSARRIEISTREYGAYIRITVADNGPGIPGELLTKIFEPFFTTKSPGQGTGLGLAISRAIIEEHHGKLWAQSEPGKGARFFVELPIIPCAEDRPATDGSAHFTGVTPDEEALENARHRILIVDDEPGIVEVLKEALGFSGYTIDTAYNGAVALQKITQETYDLVLSDLRMPDMDGEKLYHTVRRLKPDLAGRIIFLTGDTVSSNARTFLEWTGNRWFSKPFNMAELEEVIHNYLRPTALATMVQ